MLTIIFVSAKKLWFSLRGQNDVNNKFVMPTEEVSASSISEVVYIHAICRPLHFTRDQPGLHETLLPGMKV